MTGRILVLEDNPADAALVCTFLEGEAEDGPGVTVAERLSEAIECLSERTFDLVLCDLSLPDADGLESVVALAQAAPETAIIVLSGSTDGQVALQALELGAQDFLLKGQIAADALSRAMTYAVGRKRKERRLSAMVMLDSMTGLANRKAFEHRLDELAAEARAPDGLSFALLFIDLDRFKPINDQLGHAAGDRVLRVVAERLVEGIRTKDMAARLGGDEFAVLVRGPIERASAVGLAERLADALGQPIPLPPHGARRISASVGLVLCPETGVEPDELTALADAAMYEAKRGGLGRVVAYPHDDMPESSDGVAEALRHALATGPLALWWRPRLDLVARGGPTVVAVPQWEGVPPGDSSDVERLTHEVADLDLAEVLVRRAMELAAQEELRQAARQGSVVFSLAVNPHLLMRDALVADILRTGEDLAAHHVSMELSVPEAVVGPEGREIAKTLAYIVRHGLRIMVADFGASGCRLSDLCDLHVHGLRLPVAWTRDTNLWPVARGVAALGTSLGLRVVGAGAFSAAQVEGLMQAGLHGVEGLAGPSLDSAAGVLRGMAPWASAH
ncbi:MAG: diguanylate cyclase [Deltaproteobacteria bacterium]|nr:diguanylate cyclase [Deltaproteobacteria bacterium]